MVRASKNHDREAFKYAVVTHFLLNAVKYENETDKCVEICKNYRTIDVLFSLAIALKAFADALTSEKIANMSEKLLALKPHLVQDNKSNVLVESIGWLLNIASEGQGKLNTESVDFDKVIELSVEILANCDNTIVAVIGMVKYLMLYNDLAAPGNILLQLYDISAPSLTLLTKRGENNA